MLLPRRKTAKIVLFLLLIVSLIGIVSVLLWQGYRLSKIDTKVVSRYDGFTPVKEITIGDRVFIRDGEKMIPDFVTSLEKVLRPQTVYNLSVDQNKTYFANEVAVHNKDIGCGAGIDINPNNVTDLADKNRFDVSFNNIEEDSPGEYTVLLGWDIASAPQGPGWDCRDIADGHNYCTSTTTNKTSSPIRIANEHGACNIWGSCYEDFWNPDEPISVHPIYWQSKAAQAGAICNDRCPFPKALISSETNPTYVSNSNTITVTPEGRVWFMVYTDLAHDTGEDRMQLGAIKRLHDTTGGATDRVVYKEDVGGINTAGSNYFHDCFMVKDADLLSRGTTSDIIISCKAPAVTGSYSATFSTKKNCDIGYTVNVVPPPPGDVTGLTVSCTAPNRATASWNATPNASSYGVRIDDWDNSNDTADELNGTVNSCGTTHDICINDWTNTSMDMILHKNGLSELRGYTWWMNAYNAGGLGPQATINDINCAPKTCSIGDITVNGSTATLNASGNAKKKSSENVRLFVERQDGEQLGSAPSGTTESTYNGIYYYQTNTTCNSSNYASCAIDKSLTLPVGDYYAHCDLPTDPLKCSGNPFCSYKGGGTTCSGYVECSDTDNKSFCVLPASPTLTLGSRMASAYQCNLDAVSVYWSSITGAKKYQLEYSVDGGNTWTTTVTTGTSLTFNVNADKLAFVRVKAGIDCGYGGYSSTVPAHIGCQLANIQAVNDCSTGSPRVGVTWDRTIDNPSADATNLQTFRTGEGVNYNANHITSTRSYIDDISVVAGQTYTYETACIRSGAGCNLVYGATGTKAITILACPTSTPTPSPTATGVQPTATPTPIQACPAFTRSECITASGTSTAYFDWPNVANEEGYKVKRDTVLQTNLGINSTFYSQTPLTAGTTYSYTINPIYGGIEKSCPAQVVTCPAIPTNTPTASPTATNTLTGIPPTITPSPTATGIPPTATPTTCIAANVTNLSATGPESLSCLANNIKLDWTVAVGGADSYLIYRDGVYLTSKVGPNYTDTGRSPGVTHAYVVITRLTNCADSSGVADVGGVCPEPTSTPIPTNTPTSSPTPTPTCAAVAPGMASGLSPNTTTIKTTTASLNWTLNGFGNACPGPNVNSVSYYLVDTAPDLDLTNNTLKCSGVGQAPQSCSGLEDGKTYYWQVKTDNGSQSTLSTPLAWFIVNLSESWWQADSGNVYSAMDINQDWMPVGKKVIDGSLGTNSQGILRYNRSGNVSATVFNQLSLSNWKYDSAYQGELQKFTYFINKFRIPRTVNFTGSLALDSGVYYSASDTTISGSFPSGKKIQIYVDGDVTIDSNIVVPAATSSFLSIIASGDITFTANVTAVQGFYLADGVLKVETTGLENDVQFNGQGSFIGWGGVSLNRSLGSLDQTTPAETFILRPDLFINAPFEFSIARKTFMEVKP